MKKKLGEKFKYHCILNSALSDGDHHAVFPFWVVENHHGKFLLNWSVSSYQQLTTSKLSQIAEIKRSQLGRAQGDWLNKNPYVIVQQVVPGKSGTVAQKIARIVQGTTAGQRILIILESASLDKEFYKGLGIDPDNPVGDAMNFLSDHGLSMSGPFTEIPVEDIVGK